MKTLTRTLLAATLATAAFSSVALAGPGHHARGEYQHFDADHLPRHLAALGLSDAQKAQIKSLRESTHARKQQSRAEGKALHESLRALSPAAPNYTQEVDRIATQMGQQHADRVRARAAIRAQEWAILTPSQQSQLAAMPKPDFKKMREERRQK